MEKQIKVFLVRENRYETYNASYANRLFEQRMAVLAGKFKGADKDYWLKLLKDCMERQGLNHGTDDED